MLSLVTRALDFASANLLFRSAHKVRPKYIRGHVNMGMSYGAANRPDEAAKCYIKALEAASNMRAVDRASLQVHCLA